MRSVPAAVAAAAFALSAPAASALGLTADYSAVVVFGDSLSDPGNLAGTPFAPPPPYFEAMFSNGPVWALELTTGFAPGTAANFAVGGATALGDALGNTLAAQRARFDGALGLGALSLGPRPLAVHWIGSNDVLRLTDPAAAATRVADEIGDLADVHHIRDFLVLNLPDQGATPGVAARGPAAQAAISAASAAYNATLATALDTLDPAFDVTRIDIAGLFEDLLSTPADFGVSNVTESCFDGVATVCADPAAYAFWDGVHPTAKIHGEIADAAFAALAAPVPLPVPLPATLPLLAAGAFALVRLRRAA